MGQRYPTDLTEAEWTLLAPLIPAAKPGGRPRTTDMREVVVFQTWIELAITPSRSKPEASSSPLLKHYPNAITSAAPMGDSSYGRMT